MIKHDDDYYLFSTGPGILMRRSPDLRQWRAIGSVFREPPAWTFKEVPGFKGHIWAPDIAFLNGKYHLYYSISTFGSNHSCIGLAVNATLDPDHPDYRWQDKGIVVRSIAGKDNWNAIDPNLLLDEDGNAWLTFGSFWSGIKMVRIDAGTGKPQNDPPLIETIASRPGSTAIEAPFIVHRRGYYYLFVSFDQCCRGADSTYKIMVGRSRDPQGPYANRLGQPMLEGAGTLVLAGHGDCRGPGHNAVLREGETYWLVHHMYDAANDGISTLQIRELIWPEDGWPLPSEPLDAPSAAVHPLTANKLAGTWQHSVDFGDAGNITLLPNGKINDPNGRNEWTFDGRVLKLRWPRADGPGGVWVDECYLDSAGNTYVGRNQQGMVIRGHRITNGAPETASLAQKKPASQQPKTAPEASSMNEMFLKALSKGEAEPIRALLEQGADPDYLYEGKHGPRRPWHIIHGFTNSEELYQLLISYGADVTLRPEMPGDWGKFTGGPGR